MKAEVILMKCLESHRIYGVRVEEIDGDWFRTWAFPVDEKRASHEGFDKTTIKGNLFYTDDYNGCPYCGALSFAQCGHCGKLNCWNNEEKLTCGWCGRTGRLSVIEDEIKVKGSDY